MTSVQDFPAVTCARRTHWARSKSALVTSGSMDWWPRAHPARNSILPSRTPASPRALRTRSVRCANTGSVAFTPTRRSPRLRRHGTCRRNSKRGAWAKPAPEQRDAASAWGSRQDGRGMAVEGGRHVEAPGRRSAASLGCPTNRLPVWAEDVNTAAEDFDPVSAGLQHVEKEPLGA